VLTVDKQLNQFNQEIQEHMDLEMLAVKVLLLQDLEQVMVMLPVVEAQEVPANLVKLVVQVVLVDLIQLLTVQHQ
jgi:hypothetical protein